MYTIQDIKSDIAGLSHGTDIGHITNLNELFWRAGRKVISRIDPRETKRIQNLTNPLHDDVYNYTLPTDTKRIVDIRPQVNRTRGDKMRQKFGKIFDMEKAIQDDIFTIQHNSSRKFIRISKDVSPAPKTLNAVNDVDDNGTWSASGDATNVAQDKQYYVSGSASVKFDITTEGGIENDDMSAVDLNEHEDISTLFVWVYLPDASIITNVDLRWGSSSSAYWNVTETDQHDGTSFRNGWNLLGFSWNGATETGSPDSSAIDYLRVQVTSTSADTDIRVDNIISSLGEIWEIVYYSNLLFRNSSGTWINKPTTDSDIVNLDEDSYEIFLREAMIEVSRQIAGEDAGFDIQEAEKDLYGTGNRQGLYKLYNKKYPGEAIKPIGSYYRAR
jgi:hypothetical protein